MQLGLKGTKKVTTMQKADTLVFLPGSTVSESPAATGHKKSEWRGVQEEIPRP